MLKISSNVISLTRGGSADISVPITNDLTGEEYTLAEGDRLTLTIKKRTTDATPLVQKTLTGSNSFHFSPADTAGLNFGKYLYDVQLETQAGDVYTVIVPTEFQLLQEVTW